MRSGHFKPDFSSNIMWCLFLVVITVVAVSSNHVSHAQHHTAIDAFVQRLKLEKWEKDEALCLEKTLTLLENVKNFTLWATWVWNANTVPTGNLYGSWANFGNFDQCMKPPWLETHPQFKTKYCLAQLVLSDNPMKKAEYDPYGSTEEYLNSPITSGLPVNHLLWEMCVPAACHPPSIVKITRSIYDLTTFGPQAPNITVDHCQVAGDKLQHGVGFYLFIALTVSLIVMAAASTYYRLHIASDDQPPDSLETIITKSFCIIKNRQDLVKDKKEEIRVMNGMRFLTAVSIISFHEIFYMVLSGVVNSRDYDKTIEGLGGIMIIHIEVMVDTFFAMSGLLHIKGLLSNANRQQNLFSVLWKRYVRLIGPFALIIFYLISVSKYIGSGPLWIFSNELESEVCLKSWGLSLLMLNTDPKYTCHIVTWYVPCDYQLGILGTVLFYFYQKDQRVGFAAFGTAAVLSLIIPGVLTYWYELPAIHFLDLGKLLRELREYWEIGYTYTPSYSRAGAYLVGVAMGYLMTLYKPSEHRQTVSKTWSIVGTAVSLATMMYVLSLGQYYINREYNPIEAAVVTSTNRIAWAVAVCIIIGLLAAVSSNHVSHTQHHTAIDAFVQRLKLEKWEKDEALCLEKTLTLLENVKNFTLWATWVWNANTVPTGNLYGSWANFGNFDQCMKPPWLETHPQFKTKYCLAQLVLSDNPMKKAEYDPYGSTEEYLNSPITSGLPVNHLLWEMCVPAACHPPSIVKITRSIYDLTTFGPQAPNITVDHCQVAGDKLQHGVGFYLFIALTVSLIVMAAASTYYRLHIASDDQPPDSLETLITKSFCIIKNRQDLVKDKKEEIRVMNGMRFLTAVSIISFHEIFYMVLSGVVNSRDYDKTIEGLGGIMIIHIEVMVDTFFAMSGLLHIKGLLSNANRQQNLFSVLWKRYVRLIGPFALIIFYLISVSKYIGSGPLWIFSNELESEVCLKSWGLSLLMLNTDPKYTCHIVTWYVPCDYQLGILGTVLFYFYQKDQRVGFAAFGTAAVLSLIIPGVLTYWYELPAIHFLDLGKLLRELREYWEIGYTYTPSYSRAGAYLVGVAMGYLMTLYKPSEHRQTVSKTWSIVGTAVSLATMMYVLSLGQYYINREYNPIEAAVVTSTNRIAWAVAVCIIIGLLAAVSSNHVSHTQHHTAIDAFVQRLKLEKWEKDEALCLEKTLTLLENVKNFTLWATWVWNANTVPTGNLYGSWANFGNFDQCMKPPWLETHPQFKTKYCLAQLVLSDNPMKKAEYDPYGSTEEYLNSPITSGLPVNYLLWGMCVPAACHPSSIVKITRSIYDLTTFGPQAPNITVDHCQVAGDKLQYGVGFYLFIALIVSLIVMAAASTYYQLHIASADQPPGSLETIITKSFCIIKNRQDLVKDNKEEIRVMNGMRFLTAVSIISFHEIFYMVLSGVVNSRDYDKTIEGLGGIMIIHIEVMVDTFFAMSGLLHIKGLLGNANRQQNLFSVLWKRYVRLIGPFALIIFYLISVSKYIGSGPLWIFSNELESEVCLKSWRLSLLMLNTDPKYTCHIVTWYVPCDYQLGILGTVLFYFYQKDQRVGFAAFGTAAVLSLIIPGVLTYWYELPAIHFLDLGKLLRELRDYWEIGYTYTPSYSRAGAYLVGVAMGYLMTLYKPSEHRQTVSKTWSIVGTAVSLATMLYVLSLGQYYINRKYNPIEAAVVTATNRIAWAVAICIIIGLCEYGSVPVVSDILSFSYFTPLSRLSYGIYMIHPLLIQRNKFALRSPLKFDTYSIVLDTIGTLTTAIGLSFAMWLLVEAPLINISNHFLFKKSKSTQPVKQLDMNGHQNEHVKTKAA